MKSLQTSFIMRVLLLISTFLLTFAAHGEDGHEGSDHEEVETTASEGCTTTDPDCEVSSEGSEDSWECESCEWECAEDDDACWTFEDCVDRHLADDDMVYSDEYDEEHSEEQHSDEDETPAPEQHSDEGDEEQHSDEDDEEQHSDEDDEEQNDEDDEEQLSGEDDKESEDQDTTDEDDEDQDTTDEDDEDQDTTDENDEDQDTTDEDDEDQDASKLEDDDATVVDDNDDDDVSENDDDVSENDDDDDDVSGSGVWGSGSDYEVGEDSWYDEDWYEEWSEWDDWVSDVFEICEAEAYGQLYEDDDFLAIIVALFGKLAEIDADVAANLLKEITAMGFGGFGDFGTVFAGFTDDAGTFTNPTSWTADQRKSFDQAKTIANEVLAALPADATADSLGLSEAQFAKLKSAQAFTSSAGETKVALKEAAASPAFLASAAAAIGALLFAL